MSALTNARQSLADLETQHATLEGEVKAAITERENARVDEAEIAGLDRLGEAPKGALKAAQQRSQATETAHAAAAGALDIVTDRLVAARESVAAAEAQFLEFAAGALAPRYQTLRSSVRVLADELASTLVELARTDAVVSRIPLGVRSGYALLKSLGDPLQAVQDRHGVGIQISLPPDLRRFSEREILATLSNEVAAE